MKKRIYRCRRILALAAAVIMVLQLAACGNKETENSSEATDPWVWVPEFVTIEEENISFYEMNVTGDRVYYLSYDWDEETGESSQSLCGYSLTDKSVAKKTLELEKPENGSKNINTYLVAEDGSMYAVVSTYIYSEDPNEHPEPQYELCKFDAEGKLVFAKSMAEQLSGEEDAYIREIALDGEGRLYAASEKKVWLYDAEGNYQGAIDFMDGGNGWLQALGMGKDGRMYISYHSYDGTSSGDTIKELDFAGKKIGASYENFSNGNSDKLIAGQEKDFLVFNNTAVYEYDLATQTQEEVFKWLDSDINGNNVQSIAVLEDGRILAVINDWEDETNNGVVVLQKTSADQVVKKETIVIATMNGSYSLQPMAVKFNKSSDKYRISIKEYIDYDSWDGNDYTTLWSDALANLNNDIISGNCPDIIDIFGLNLSQLASKGVFEDLNAYLEKSEKLGRSDFVENLLTSYTFDGVLVCIPESFMLQTLVGKTSEVGSEMGWTVEELMAYSDAHPGAELLEGATKAYIMQVLMMYNEDRFVDWAAGECHFDSDEFKSLLEFVNRFPEEYDYNSNNTSTHAKLKNGNLLLDSVHISDFNGVQMYPALFEDEVTFIGYPTMDGSVGCSLSAYQAYAITSKSKHKDAAWEFIEASLLQERGRFSRNGFPSVKSKLDAMAKEAVTVEYLKDEETGEYILDENGEKIRTGGTSSISYEDGWSYTYREATQEEVDLIYDMMELAKPMSYNYADMIMSIVNEEAEAFYKGQKTADEVAAVIQSRVKIYVSENN